MRVNSVLSKEHKIMIRSWKTSALITLYLLILSLVAVFFTLNVISSQTSSAIETENVNLMYFGLAFVQFFIITYIVAPSSAGTISGEKEKQTLDILLSTRLSSFTIILGKILSSLSRIGLLIISSLPIFVPVILFGNINFSDLILLAFYNIVVAFLVESIGIFFSTFTKKSSLAFILTYAVIIFFSVGTIMLSLCYSNFVTSNTSSSFLSPIIYINPISGLMGLFSDQAPVFGAIGATEHFKILALNIGFDLILSIVLIWLSAKKLNPLSKLNISFNSPSKNK